MDSERQPRVACYQRATLTVLSDPQRMLSARAIELTGRRMRIAVDEPIPLGAPVSIELSDWLALGEVCECRAEFSHYIAELWLDELVMGLWELGACEWIRHASEPPSFVLQVSKQPLP